MTELIQSVMRGLGNGSVYALLAFGYLFGFVGLLVAVPLAATIGVLARFALRRYLESSLYTGEKSS